MSPRRRRGTPEPPHVFVDPARPDDRLFDRVAARAFLAERWEAKFGRPMTDADFEQFETDMAREGKTMMLPPVEPTRAQRHRKRR